MTDFLSLDEFNQRTRRRRYRAVNWALFTALAGSLLLVIANCFRGNWPHATAWGVVAFVVLHVFRVMPLE